MTTGERIRSARKFANITQQELADRLGIPYQSIGQWERDKRNPKVETILRLAKALNVPMSYLMGDTNDPNDRSKPNWMELPNIKDNEPDLYLKQIIFDVTPDPEWEDLHRKLENGTITLEERQRFFQMMDDGLERARKAFSEKKARILSHMDKLNDEGQQKAVERVEELTEIPKYRRQGTDPTPTENGTEAPETGKK